MKIQETPRHVIFIALEKEKGQRAVIVTQLLIQKFNSLYKPEPTNTTVEAIIEKWQHLTTLGVIVTPAARHAFAEILHPETSMAKPTATTPPKKEVKKESKTTTPPKKAEPKKEEKKSVVTLTKKPKTERIEDIQGELPFETATVMQAPSATGLKVGKTIKGDDPKPYIPTPDTEEPTMASKPTQKTSPEKTTPVKAAPKPGAMKVEPKKAAKPEPKKAAKPEPKKAAKPELKKEASSGSRGGDYAGKKIKPVAKADMSVIREGSVRRKIFDIILKSATVAEALSKKFNRKSDNRPTPVPTSYIQEAVDLGFITLV